MSEKMGENMSEKVLAGKLALITGGSKGLGRAMAVALAGAGAKLALVSRDREKLESVAAEVKAAGSEAFVFVGDVGDEADVARVEKEVSAQAGRIDILVNNAGIKDRKSVV